MSVLLVVCFHCVAQIVNLKVYSNKYFLYSFLIYIRISRLNDTLCIVIWIPSNEVTFEVISYDKVFLCSMLFTMSTRRLCNLECHLKWRKSSNFVKNLFHKILSLVELMFSMRLFWSFLLGTPTFDKVDIFLSLHRQQWVIESADVKAFVLLAAHLSF